MSATLKELGEQLRQAREGRRLSMQEASEITKISKRILTAFEQADADLFPHPVYAKGFIKNYAKLLGLDPEEFGRAMGQATGRNEGAYDLVDGVECPDRGDALRHQADPAGRKRSWPSVLLLLLLVALLGALVWYLLIQPASTPDLENGGAQHEAVSPESAQPEPVQPESARAEDESVESESVESESVESESIEPGAAQETTVAAGAEDETTGQTTGQAIGTDEARTENTLRIKSRDEEGSWVGVYDVEGETLLRDFTVTGQGEVSLQLTQARSLRIGRIQGVDVWFGGEAMAFEGVGTRNIKLPPGR